MSDTQDDSGRQTEFETLKKSHRRLQQSQNFLRVINDFAVRIAQLNTLEDIVWAIAKHAIGQLGFVDCIIYLVDDEHNTLIQAAAHGPKNPREQVISDPIIIEIGTGIVGAVAATGKAERIPDTRKDPRYILDDEFRYSELSVPLVHQGKVIGVIDSEHPEENFYTLEHQEILTTIASLSAPRIAFIRATESALKQSESVISQQTAEMLETMHKLQAAQEKLLESKEHAEAMNEAKSAFISQMSHELRTPLTSIIGYAQILQRDPSITPKQLKGINIIHRSAYHLLAIINDILTYSKQERGILEYQREPVNVNDLLIGISEMIFLQTQEKNLSLETLTDPKIPKQLLASIVGLRQTLINLANNAVKFTNTGEIKLRTRRMDVRTSSTADQSEKITAALIRFEIIDTGIGVSPEDQTAIFLPFEQAGSPQNRSKGTGLGLSISQQIVEAMGGKIQIESELNQGSRFWFDLWLELPAEAKEPAIEIHPYARIKGYTGARRTILVVDDSDDTRSLLSGLLKPLGFNVAEATNGQEALDILETTLPDLIIMDILMPGLNGIEASTRIRNIPEFASIPIIAASAHISNSQEAADILKVCDSLLNKPLILRRLWKQLSQHLNFEWIRDPEQTSIS